MMNKTFNLLLLLLAVSTAGSAQAQTAVVELPLSGPAYRLAQQAYASAAHGAYGQAQAQLQEAIRLRPDSMALRRQLRELRAQQRDGMSARRGSARDPGYAAAAAAYRAYDGKRYDQAVTLARQAVAAAPHNPAYWLLLGNALIETHDYDRASEVLAQGADNTSDQRPLLRRQLELQRERAAMAAAEVFRAQADNEGEAELEAARRAVALAPQEMEYRLMLVVALLHNEQIAEAERAADQAHAMDERQPGPLLLRAYARVRLGQADAAHADFILANRLATSDGSPVEQRDARLLQADAERVLQQPQAAHGAEKRNQPVSSRQFPVPALDCSRAGAENVNPCHVTPGAQARDAGFDAATRGYQAMQQQQYTQAAQAATEAVARSPQNAQYRLLQIDALQADGQDQQAVEAIGATLQAQGADSALLARRAALRARLGDSAGARADGEAALAQGGLPVETEIMLLARTGHPRQARERFLAARDGGALDALDDLQLAYLAAQTGDAAGARDAFQRADTRGALPARALTDAGYAAVQAGDDETALAWFKRSLDNSADAGHLPQTPQQRFDTRRSIATIDRSGGFIASLTRSGGGPSAGNRGRPGASAADSTLQAGAEAYWRPFGYQGGRPVEVFGRVFQTLDDQSGGATGTQTAQATVGARWKPLASQNLVLSVGRLIPLGSQSSADWLVQAAYSDGIGTDLRVDRPQWWTTQWYGEVGHYLRNPQTYGLASVQGGRSFRLDGLSEQLVLFPHLSLNADFNSLNSHRSAIGLGPGVNLRYWFRSDRYHAPRSTVDLSLQYRWRIGGDERAQGFFLSTTLSY
ncbi:NfrA family protein [Herbaspirillum huttiense]|uniref:NfrA family protein n=1 Tax=Herbaspirillum huttiense TaxID=863372 RepID=UPI0039B07FA9